MDANMKNQLDMIGRSLRRYRTNAKLTQKQVAEQAGISVSHYANLERGSKSMSAWTLYALADVLNVSADLLLYGEKCDPHIQNIRCLLHGKSEDTVIAAENMIRALLNHFPEKDGGAASEE